MRKQNNTLYCGEFEITKREVGASITLVSILLIIGILIGNGISNKIEDRNLKYNQAIQINDDKDLFEYGMRTNVGNAFIYGTLKAVDTVTYPEIGGEYIFVKKIEKRYEKHEREVIKEDSKGNAYTEKEEYYEWDIEQTESIHADEISFCGVTFPYSKINLPNSNYIDTINGSKVYSWKSGEYVKVKFEYYGVATEYTGTIFTELKNNAISDNSKLYVNRTTEETLECLASNSDIYLFWFFWILLICGCVFSFVYLDNKWLEG